MKPKWEKVESEEGDYEALVCHRVEEFYVTRRNGIINIECVECHGQIEMKESEGGN